MRALVGPHDRFPCGAYLIQCKLIATAFCLYYITLFDHCRGQCNGTASGWPLSGTFGEPALFDEPLSNSIAIIWRASASSGEPALFDEPLSILFSADHRGHDAASPCVQSTAVQHLHPVIKWSIFHQSLLDFTWWVPGCCRQPGRLENKLETSQAAEHNQMRFARPRDLSKKDVSDVVHSGDTFPKKRITIWTYLCDILYTDPAAIHLLAMTTNHVKHQPNDKFTRQTMLLIDKDRSQACFSIVFCQEGVGKHLNLLAFLYQVFYFNSFFSHFYSFLSGLFCLQQITHLKGSDEWRRQGFLHIWKSRRSHDGGLLEEGPRISHDDARLIFFTTQCPP